MRHTLFLPLLGVFSKTPITDEEQQIIDCSTYQPWVDSFAGSPDAGKVLKFYKDELAYESSTWVDHNTVPGENMDRYTPWTMVGRCEPGTMGTGVDGPGTEDCSDIYAWSPFTVYTREKNLVHHGGLLYKTAQWTLGEKPGNSSVWKLQGRCQEGTDTLGPEEPIQMPAEWKLDLTCDCCEKCGTVRNGKVVCSEEEEDQCWHRWCPPLNQGKPNAQKCQASKNADLFANWEGDMRVGKETWPERVYAPYVDGGLYGWPKLTELAAKYGVKHFIVAFAASASKEELRNGKCQAAFAGVTNVATGPTYMDRGNLTYLYDELDALRAEGGDFIISFGGAYGTELADSEECQRGDAVENLKGEYARVLDLLNTNRILFDISGNSFSILQKHKGWAYRFQAMKEMKAERPGLEIFWSLPVMPFGLDTAGEHFTNMMMEMDAPWDVLNLLNMNYGVDPRVCDNDHIDQCERDAVENVARQLFNNARDNGYADRYQWSQYSDIFPRLGTTPMIGKNNVARLIYTLDAAKTNLKHWQTKVPVRLVSNWSVGRDHPCKQSDKVSTVCSSYDGQTKDYEFLGIFNQYTSSQ